MFKIEFGEKQATVSLSSKGPNDYAEQRWEGRPEPVAMVRRYLDGASGAFGHLLDDVTTPIDLHYAVFSRLERFSPVVVEGADLVEVYDPGIPEGAVT
jgi:hypothetical protein